MIRLEDIIPDYLLKELLLYVIYFLAFTVLALFLILIIHKFITERNEKKRAGYANHYKNLLSQYLENHSIRIKRPADDLQYDALADVCIERLSKSSGATEDRIKKFIKEETFLIEHYKKTTSSSSWLKRFIAIERLGFFVMEDLRKFFTEIIDAEQSPEVKAKAVWALSLIADEKALKVITEKLSSGISQSSKFNEYIYTNVIHSFKKNGTAQKLVTFLNGIRQDQTIPSLIKRDFIEACGSAGLNEAESTINEYFLNEYFVGSSHDILMKVACIRALGKIAGSGMCEAIMMGLSDDDWRVRAVSAKAASICPDYAFKPQFRRLLYDSVFYVRINAAKTLAKLGEKGISTLKSEINSKDRFVRDTVRYILEEEGVHV